MLFCVPEGSGASGSRGERFSKRVSSRGNQGCRVRDCYSARPGNQLSRERVHNKKQMLKIGIKKEKIKKEKMK